MPALIFSYSNKAEYFIKDDVKKGIVLGGAHHNKGRGRATKKTLFAFQHACFENQMNVYVK